MQNLNEQIRAVLKSKGITQKKLCEEIQVTEGGLSKNLNKGIVKLDLLEKIAKVCGVELSVQFGDVLEKTESYDLRQYEQLMKESNEWRMKAYAYERELIKLGKDPSKC